MFNKDSLIKVLEMQSNNIKITQIAKELELTTPKLKKFMEEEGYSYNDGVFTKGSISNSNDVMQLSLTGIPESNEDIEKKVKKTRKRTKVEEVTEEPTETPIEQIEVEKDPYDQFCEMRDWFLTVKDSKKLKDRINTKTKEVQIEEGLLEENKRVTLKINEEVLLKLEILVGNTGQDRDSVINQAIINLLSDYKHLI